MTSIRRVEPVVRICAVICGCAQGRQTAIDWLVNHWGAVDAQSKPIPFEAGGFYANQMGTGLQKVLLAWCEFCDPGELASWKTQTNTWEDEIAAQVSGDLARPVNLDPGYISQAKLVLATVKDRDHRVYLCDGIFGEVTLNYVGAKWISHRWTYPSYRDAVVSQFANQQRHRLRKYLAKHGLFRHA